MTETPGSRKNQIIPFQFIAYSLIDEIYLLDQFAKQRANTFFYAEYPSLVL